MRASSPRGAVLTSCESSELRMASIDRASWGDREDIAESTIIIEWACLACGILTRCAVGGVTAGVEDKELELCKEEDAFAAGSGESLICEKNCSVDGDKNGAEAFDKTSTEPGERNWGLVGEKIVSVMGCKGVFKAAAAVSNTGRWGDMPNTLENTGGRVRGTKVAMSDARRILITPFLNTSKVYE